MPKKLNSAVLCILIALMALILCNKAARKPLWFDELLTLTVSEYPIGSEMWRASTAGFEFNPPGIYVATRLSELAFGRSPLTDRLPAIIGGVIALICTYVVASRRSGRVAGYIGITLLYFSGASSFFIEARGYALVLAGTMVSWACWQARVDSGGRRTFPLFGICFGLCIALASHMWAVVVPACFIASAVALYVKRKWLDKGALAAMIVPVAVTLCYPPLVANTRGIVFGGPIYHNGLSNAYLTVLGRVPQVVLLSCVVYLATKSLHTNRPSVTPENGKRLSVEDTTLGLALLCAPIVIYAATEIAHTAFMSRYALVAVLGACIIVSQLFAMFERKFLTICWLLMLSIGLGIRMHGVALNPVGWRLDPPRKQEVLAVARATMPEEPIVYASGLGFLQADYYSDTDVAERLAYVADRDLAKQFVGTDGVDSGFILGRNYLKLKGRVLSYSQLTASHRTFLLVDDDHPLNWLPKKLRLDGAELRELGIQRPGVFRVTLP